MIENNRPTVEIRKKRRLPKSLIITLMVVLGVACATVANPAMANRAHTFTGVLGKDNTSSVVATVEQALVARLKAQLKYDGDDEELIKEHRQREQKLNLLGEFLDVLTHLVDQQG